MKGVVLLIGGLDPSGNAGLLVDWETVRAHGGDPFAVAAVLTSQTEQHFFGMKSVAPEVILMQLKAAPSLKPVALKTGALGSAAAVLTTAEFIRKNDLKNVVVDPVLFASTGGSLLEPSAKDAYLDALLPLARVATPNAGEARELLKEEAEATRDLSMLARALAKRCGCAAVVKGADLPEQEVTLAWFDPVTGREGIHRAPRLTLRHFRGKGCRFASALACRLAEGAELEEAVLLADAYVRAALTRS